MPIRSAWRLRDTLTATALFLASSAFTLWQNARVAVLWDLSYLLDTSYRISLGQMPYRDFPFAHAPLTFLIHAAVIRVFGRVYAPHILLAAVEAGCATLLSWRILLRLLQGANEDAPRCLWAMATLLAAPLCVVGIYGIYPHPIYDSDAMLVVLAAIYLLLLETQKRAVCFLAGLCCVVPVFVKQNIGLIFLASVVAAVGVVALTRRLLRLNVAPQGWVLCGMLAGCCVGLALVQIFFGVHPYVYWTIDFARQRRLPGLVTILGTYHQTSLLWTLPAALAGVAVIRLQRPWSRMSGLGLLAAPFLWTVASLAVSDDPADRADQLLSLWPHLLVLSLLVAFWQLRPERLQVPLAMDAVLPMVLLGTIHGTFLSQQLWGSTYSLWPLLMMLIVVLLLQVRAIAWPMAAVVALAFFVCGGLYAVSHERLSYVHLEGDLARATLPELRGLATPGPWIPAFEELVRVTRDEIPAGDGILLIPGENPFYYATGRTPQFPFELFDPATDPYTTQETRDEVRKRKVRWLIVNRETQLTGLPHPDLPKATAELIQDFVPYRTLSGYSIYHRK